MGAADKPAHETTRLLGLAKGGDRALLEELLKHVWPRIEDWVRRERSKTVKARFDTMDCAQDVAMQLVQYLPRVVISDSETFRKLLYRMIQNTLRNKGDYLAARRRRLSLERPLSGDSSIALDPPADSTSPSFAAGRGEEQAWIRFALALMDPLDQELILRHAFDSESFVDIAKRIDSTPDAVRMRFTRALGRLNGAIGRLKRGDIRDVLDETKPADGDDGDDPVGSG